MLLKFKFVHVFLVALFISCSGNWVCGQTPLSAWDSFPPLYFIEVNRVKYSVIKTSEAKILGMRGSRGFLDPEGRPVTDPGVIKKLVKTSWVWENIIQPSSIPLNFHGLEKPEKRIPIIRGVLDTYKDVKIYEITQDLIVRTFINVSVVIVAGPTSTSSLIKTMGKLTVGNLIDTLSSGASLKNVLGAVSVVSLWDALAKYSSIQSEIERLGSLTINYDIANRIYELYVDAYVRDLPNEALLVSIMPKRWKDLVMQALKTAGSETLSFVFPYHSSMSSIERAQLVDTAHLIKCVDFLYDRIGSLPNFERVGESKRNTKTSVGLFEKTMMELEKQWVSQFKSPIQIIAPQIATISPPQVQAGQFTLTINGSNFDSGAIDQVYNPSGQLIGSGAQSGGLVSRSSNQIVVRENLTGAPAGTYTVKVKNSDGKLSNPINIVVTSVVQLTPTLTQTPASGPVGTTFTQKGSGFTQNRTATIWGRDSVGNVARIGTINTDSTGSFTSTWIAQTPGNNLARWAVDDATGKKSNEIVFNVTAAIISDTRPPNVTSFSASASQITQGQSVTLSYSVTDDVGLKQVELWRADDTAGVNFREIKRVTVSGTSYSGSFSDAPPVPGTYRYGIHVVDMANKWNCERNSQSGGSPGVYGPRQVVVVSATPTISRPSPPTPVSPGSPNEPGTVINTLTPTLQWTAVPNAEYYALAISAYPYGTVNIVYNPQKIYGTSIIVPSGVLVKGKKYRWNMQAYNSAGWSSVSTTLYFQIP